MQGERSPAQKPITPLPKKNALLLRELLRNVVRISTAVPSRLSATIIHSAGYQVLKNPSALLARWSLRVQQFEIKIMHESAKWQTHADCFRFGDADPAR